MHVGVTEQCTHIYAAHSCPSQGHGLRRCFMAYSSLGARAGAVHRLGPTRFTSMSDASMTSIQSKALGPGAKELKGTFCPPACSVSRSILKETGP